MPLAPWMKPAKCGRCGTATAISKYRDSGTEILCTNCSQKDFTRQNPNLRKPFGESTSNTFTSYTPLSPQYQQNFLDGI